MHLSVYFLILSNKTVSRWETGAFLPSVTTLIKEIHVYEEATDKGQWLKSIVFKLPIIEDKMEVSLDDNTHVETVCLLERKA